MTVTRKQETSKEGRYPLLTGGRLTPTELLSWLQSSDFAEGQSGLDIRVIGGHTALVYIRLGGPIPSTLDLQTTQTPGWLVWLIGTLLNSVIGLAHRIT